MEAPHHSVLGFAVFKRVVLCGHRRWKNNLQRQCNAALQALVFMPEFSDESSAVR